MAVPSEVYYRNAMAQFGTSYNFLVFSDDLAWCKQHLKGQAIAYSEGRTAIQDMHLMSACSHNIISNSTFSWWAAWLNARTDKCVVAPRIWFNPELQPPGTYDVVPEDWTAIDG